MTQENAQASATQVKDIFARIAPTLGPTDRLKLLLAGIIGIAQGHFTYPHGDTVPVHVTHEFLNALTKEIRVYYTDQYQLNWCDEIDNYLKTQNFKEWPEPTETQKQTL